MTLDNDRPAPPAGLDRVIGSACAAGGVLAGLCMNALVAIVLGEMLARNLFNASFGFVLDLGGWLFVALSFLALGWVMRERAHIRLTLLLDSLAPQRRLRLSLAADLLSLGFCVFFLVSIWHNLAQVYRTGVTAPSALDVPLYPVWVIVLAGTVLLTAQLASDLVATARVLRSGGARQSEG